MSLWLFNITGMDGVTKIRATRSENEGQLQQYGEPTEVTKYEMFFAKRDGTL